MASEDRLKDYFVYTDEDFKAEQFWAVENQPCDLLSNEVDYEDCENECNLGRYKTVIN